MRSQTGAVSPQYEAPGNVEMENAFLVATVTGECVLLAFNRDDLEVRAGILHVLQ